MASNGRISCGECCRRWIGVEQVEWEKPACRMLPTVSHYGHYVLPFATPSAHVFTGRNARKIEFVLSVDWNVIVQRRETTGADTEFDRSGFHAGVVSCTV